MRLRLSKYYSDQRKVFTISTHTEQNKSGQVPYKRKKPHPYLEPKCLLTHSCYKTQICWIILQSLGWTDQSIAGPASAHKINTSRSEKAVHSGPQLYLGEDMKEADPLTK